jgi:hypothetical protein
METDRELLERAAKAAGMDGQWCEFHGMDVGQDAYGIGDPCVHRWGDKLWNPLTDDGDALRLAVKLGLGLMFIPTNARGDEPFTNVCRSVSEDKLVDCYEGHGSDPFAATRRAIVRAAASLAPKE